LFAVNLVAKDRVIENPAYEFNPSGIVNVAKIEIDDDETRVYVHTTFIPKWWVMFSKKVYIEDCATGKKWYVTDIRKGEFDKKIFMPASGDSTFILVFPKLDKSVVKINYYEEDENSNTCIYGISLNPKTKPRPTNVKVPQEVKKWLNNELSKAKRKTPMNLDAGEFFSKDTARLIGYIKGYDQRAGFTSGMIYLGNDITNDDLPRVVRIYPDGRFECLLPVSYPMLLYISFQRRNISFYIQPGTTLSMILDWEEFRTADRLRNIRYKFSDIQYDGATASINRELTEFHSKLEELPYNKIYGEIKKKEPDEYKSWLDQLISKYADAYRQAATDKNMSKTTSSIIKNDFEVQYAGFLLDYEGDYRHGENKKDLPIEFYGFLKNVPVTDKEILTSNYFSSFINLLEYSSILYGTLHKNTSPTPEKTLKQYLYEELGLQQTSEDTQFFQDTDSLSKQLQSTDLDADKRKELTDSLVKINKDFSERYKKQIEDYVTKYMKSNILSQETITEQWRKMDSVYTNVLKLDLGIVSDMIKTRKLNMMFAEVLNADDENAKKLLASIKKLLNEDYLKQEAEQLFNKYFAPDKSLTYKLPDTEDARAFKKIIDPFKGKYILVDFWAIWCGPCIHGIKQSKSMRESYKDSKDVAFVFITSEEDSPSDKYEQFVKEQELTNTYRVATMDYHYFRQLFTFNGIPHYVVVNREGEILNNTEGLHNFEYELKTLLENEK
jgi:thiol-disulfide isomerase/thioredoxin